MPVPFVRDGILKEELWRAKVRQVLSERFAEPMAHIIAKRGLSPNTLTVTGGLLGIGAGALIGLGHVKTGGLLVLAGGVLDLLDGAVARVSGKTTPFGALLDSTIDRISEAAILFGLLVLYLGRQSTQEVILIYATLVGSVLVSYVRARAEAVGLKGDVGLLTRGERVIILGLGLLLNQTLALLWILAPLTYITAGQRLLYARQQANKEGGQGA